MNVGVDSGIGVSVGTDVGLLVGVGIGVSGGKGPAQPVMTRMITKTSKADPVHFSFITTGK